MTLTKNILIDGNNLIHRAHAVFVGNKHPEDALTSANGYPTGLIYGIFSMLSNWMDEMSNSSKIYFVMDGKSEKRLALDPNYKKKENVVRPGIESNSIRLSDGYFANSEIEVVIHLLSLLGIDIFHNHAEEADDIIASFIKQNIDDINIIVSSDIDFYQILSWSDKIIIYRPGSGTNRFYDAEKAEEHLFKKFKVKIPPDNVRMFKAMTGDPSDNIIGIYKVRKKLVAPLCHHLSVDEIYNTGFPGFSKLEKQRASESYDRIKTNYELVGLDSSINLSSSLIKSNPDFLMASKILQEDLNIHSISTSSFKVGNKTRTSMAYNLVPDFLRDI